MNELASSITKVVGLNAMTNNNKSSTVAEMGDRLLKIDMSRKVGGCCAPFRGGGELGPHLMQCRLGRGLPSYQLVS